MSDFSDEMAAVALEAITQNGEICTFTRKTKGEYQPTNLSHASSTPVEYQAHCLPYEFTLAELAQVTVTQGDRKLLVPVTTTSGADFEPIVGDSVNIGGVKQRVKNILNPVRVNGANVLFILQIGI